MRWQRMRQWQNWIKRRWGEIETDYTQLAMKFKFRDKKLMRQQSQLRELNDDEKRQENSV